MNFAGEFLSLYGGFERLPILGMLAASSMVLSAAYSIYLFNRIAYGGSFSVYMSSMTDVTLREFSMLFFLAISVIILGVYPSIILDGLHYNVSNLIYSIDTDNLAYICLGSSNNISLRNSGV